MVPKTAEEIEADHAAKKAAIEDVRWSPKFGVGLTAGVAMGVVFYFITVWALPAVYAAVNIIPGN
jgi:AAT family amino acid transporter